jgi:exodeoxyribonuclease-3
MTTNITTWNINGYRAAFAKTLPGWIQEHQPDVLCLQEVKAHWEQLTHEQKEIPGYQVYWNAAQRPGYSGVATLTKKQPEEMHYGLGLEEFDNEGRVCVIRQDGYLLYNIYFPNGQRGLERVDYKLRFYRHLLEQADEWVERGQQVIITGDFNTAHNEIDLANPKENEQNSGFLRIERDMIDLYLEHGWVDVFRTLYPEKVQYTWWTYRMNARRRNIGWRLDYYLVSPGLMDRVDDVIIHDQVMGSDHCPVTLLLKD